MANKWTQDNFETEVLQSDIPVLVDFYADWCGPCKMMAPVVEKVGENYEGRLKVGKVNVDENQDLAMKYRIMSIPALLLFNKGEVIGTQVGAVSMNELEQFVGKINL
ncbi:MAG: thioredoxin [Lachnospiraceae bacterium]|nr:thioredoxin [Lachnospiraceae bacterium]